ncbi:MAG: hypothetical protein A2365_00840 [Candidatus Nealsonbacteria bacterium RIFOXYB1_FULL_40_15]|uniref:ABC transporter domain-containing protein n=2 Tax=Candidatus Nealsoniibacteriota TaxID=1817911 RepID=A0A1G2ES36_9BACT|nr:MAG: hypothetical protein A2365_00840 [Candidatus Nealsonbacteria bacterium RIFOXYB1_FULL_40_15]OGZ28068.1 MAG: hypothetical protein A2427_03320 [Candidatus Nealsonbacteria bacterium RIFOXYC1_FULL_40_7]OGZ28529.1 MAG: hypothetical protein A2562_03530 [Candidatus Nealsonbacteria bacterium RIFOXYD1_FULL_39_11]
METEFEATFLNIDKNEIRKKLRKAGADLSLKPDLLICDEPFSSIDIKSQKQIIRIFRDIKKSKTTILLIAHNLDIVKKLSDYAVIMLDGKIVESGSTDKIYNNPVHRYTKQLLSSD